MTFRSTASYWLSSATQPSYGSLQGDLEVDVVIIGAGITGITAAVLLQRAGKRVAVLEAERVFGGVTGHTTAHLTEAIDTRFKTLTSDFGKSGAQLAAQASRAAIDRIEAFIDERGIECDFRRLPGYLYTESEKDLAQLHDEHHAAKDAGVLVEMTREVPLPFPAAAAIVFPNQAEVHIGKYMAGLCAELAGSIYENTRVSSVEDGDPCTVVTERGTVRAKQVIEATNVPLTRVVLQTRFTNYRSYVVALRGAPRLNGLFWDTADPYHYLRSSNDVLIVGGEDHEVGAVEETGECYEKLLAYSKERFGDLALDSNWSAQVIEPNDGLPFIGKNRLDTNVFVATGYSGNGITFGTAAGMLLTDLVLGRDNPQAELFSPTRVKPIAAAKEFIVHNTEVALRFVGDRLKPAEAKSVDDVGPGEGKIVSCNGRRLAVYRTTGGDVHAVSPICTHLGCYVRFNEAEKTWDCPCHGSRFDTEGGILNGPAVTPLERVDVTAEKKG